MKRGNRLYDFGYCIIIARSKKEAIDLLIECYGYEYLREIEVTPSSIKPMTKEQMRFSNCGIEVDMLGIKQRKRVKKTYKGNEGEMLMMSNYYELYKLLRGTSRAAIILEDLI